MADVIVAILNFPNDPTNNRTAHQMYVALQTSSYINLYSISSILGKERRVYGVEKDDYITILPPEYLENGFKVPSFIDCTKMYQVAISDKVNFSVLAQRKLTAELRQRIEAKIAEKKKEGRHTVYQISERDFCAWNPRV